MLETTTAQDGLTAAQEKWNARVDELLGPNHQLVETLQDYYDLTGNTDEELEDLSLSMEVLNDQVEKSSRTLGEAKEAKEKYEKSSRRSKKTGCI